MTWWLPIFLSSFLVSQLRVPFVHAWFCPQSWPKAIIPSGWQPAIYGTQTGHTQWTLLDLWILNPFSPTGLEPGCSACTIGSCASRSNFGKMVFCNAKSKAKDGLPTAWLKSSLASSVPGNGICWTSGTSCMVTLWPTLFFWLSWESSLA